MHVPFQYLSQKLVVKEKKVNVKCHKSGWRKHTTKVDNNVENILFTHQL